MAYNTIPTYGSDIVVSDDERLRVLIKIAEAHSLSLDDLDDESCGLDGEAFCRWSATFAVPVRSELVLIRSEQEY